jgi:hypothetical protein
MQWDAFRPSGGIRMAVSKRPPTRAGTALPGSNGRDRTTAMSIRTSATRKALAATLLLLPAAIWLARALDTTVADALNSSFVLAGATEFQRRHLEQIMFVPLSAVVVAICKLTLGLRVLGLYKPILLALAFHTTGIGPGLVLVGLALAVVTAAHSLLSDSHSYGRLAIVLTLVCVLLLLGGFVRTEIVGFPIIALCVLSETFGTKLRLHGMAEAFARTTATVVTAALILLAASLPGLIPWLLRHPEMLVAQIGLVLVVEGWLDLRLLTPPSRRLRWAPVRLMATGDPMLTE